MQLTIKYVPITFNWGARKVLVKRALMRVKRIHRDILEFRMAPSVRKRLAEGRESSGNYRGMNEVARVIDQFDNQFEAYWTALYTKYGAVSIQVKSADQIVTVLNWFRGHGYRSMSFKDDRITQSRDYKLEHRETGKEIRLYGYFSGGDCKFVETGEVEHIAAIAAHDKPVLELQCDGVALPTE